MKKIFFWSPHISNVATIKNVINSAMSLKRYNKKPLNVSIIDAVGEWRKYLKELEMSNINLFELPGLNLNKLFPIEGFFKSRIIYFLIFFLKYNSFKKLIKKEKPDYLIIHLISFLPLSLLIFSKFETKFILRISGLPRLTLFRKILWKLISKKIYMVTCPSKKTRDDLIRKKIFLEKNVKILYDPIIEVNRINKYLKDKNTDDILNKKYFLNIGRLTKQKNQILLIRAFSKILDDNINLNLIIVGEGEKRVYLEKYIKNKNLEDKVFLIGHIKNVYPIIKNSLAVISTSLWEDPGAVMIEASYCNKNVISSNCPNGPKEFLSSKEGSYLFENNDMNSLIDKINLFLKESKNKKNAQILSCKKKTRNYTIFKHYKTLGLLLNLN